MIPSSTTVSVFCVTFLMATAVQSAVIRDNQETTDATVPSIKELPILDRAVRSIDDMPQKRPFCNAFTGCGRKRSGLNVEQMPRDSRPREMFNSVESPNNIFDFNSEPAVADIMQQIMSEAKVWDAIQAANRELNKSPGMNLNNYPAFSAQ